MAGGGQEGEGLGDLRGELGGGVVQVGEAEVVGLVGGYCRMWI